MHFLGTVVACHEYTIVIFLCEKKSTIASWNLQSYPFACVGVKVRTFRMPWNGSFSDAPGISSCVSSNEVLANAFTRRHPSETLNENVKHDHSMYLEWSSILHSSFLPQISKSLKPTKPTHARIHAHLSQTREECTPDVDVTCNQH